MSRFHYRITGAEVEFILWAALLVVFTSGVVLVPLLLNPAILYSGDGLMHAAMTASIGYYDFPPHTLYFPDYPLIYHWFPDAVFYGLLDIFGVQCCFLNAWPWLTLVLALLLGIAAFNAGQAFGLPRGWALFGAFLALFGLNLLALVFYVAHTHSIGLLPPGGGINVSEVGWLSVYDFDKRVRGILSKIYAPNGFVLALAGFVLSVGLLARIVKPQTPNRPDRTLLRVTVYVLAGTVTILSNVLIGLVLSVSALVVSTLLWATRGRYAIMMRMAPATVASGLLVVIAAFYMLSLGASTGGGRVSMHLPDLEQVKAILFVPLTTYLLAGAAILSLRFNVRLTAETVTSVGIAILFAGAWSLDLPDGNEYKFGFALYFLLLFPALQLVHRASAGSARLVRATAYVIAHRQGQVSHVTFCAADTLRGASLPG